MIALDNGDKIRGDAAAATVVDFTLHGFVGTVATQLADGQLANSIGDLYTAGAAGIGVSSIILVNTDSSARAVNLYITPSGGTARRLIPKNLVLGIGFSLHTDGKVVRVMDASGQVLNSFFNHASSHTDGTDDIQNSSLTQKGIVEIATIAETGTGTDAGRAVSPDGLQGSIRNLRFLLFTLVGDTTDVAADTNIGGDFTIPFAGEIVQDDSFKDFFAAYNTTAGTTGTMVVDVHLNGTTIMNTNKLDIESTEKDTTTATTQPDLTTTSVSAGDILTFDIDAVHTTAAKGLKVIVAIRPT